MSLMKEFRDFAVRGNVIDLAVGLIVGAEFGKIVNSLVTDIVMPPIGLLIGNVDFRNLFVTLKTGKIPGPYLTLPEAQAAGAVTMNIGIFITSVITFTIVAFSVFLVVKMMNRFHIEQALAPAPPPAPVVAPPPPSGAADKK